MDEVEAKLLEAIRNDPEDDDARLVYADWLEQRGDSRAELVRVELQLFRLPVRFEELARDVDPAWLAAIGHRYRVVLVEPGANMIGTIKLVRELSGLGLKDAKDLVDGARAGRPAVVATDLERSAADRMAWRFDGLAVVRVEPRRSMPPSLARRIVLQAIDPKRRIDAIKAVREVTGLGLAAARALVDKLPADLVTTGDPDHAAAIVATLANVGAAATTE